MATGGSFPIVPRLSYRQFQQIFAPASVTGAKGSFTAGRGRLDITVIIPETNYMVNLTVDGGYGWGAYDVNAQFTYIEDSIQSSDGDATATCTTGYLTTITLVTGAADDGGRTFLLRFSTYPTILPSIEKISGNALTQNIKVVVKNTTASA